MRRAGNLLTLAALGCLLVLWAVALRPEAAGGPALYIVVRGSSMLPAYQTGDLLITHSVPAYAVGDIVAYRVPQGEIGAGHVVVHRIVGGDGVRGFMVKGDNNPAPDPWSPRSADIEGKAWVLVPGLGRAVAWVHHPVTAGGLAAAMMVMYILVRSPRGSGRPRVRACLLAPSARMEDGVGMEVPRSDWGAAGTAGRGT